MIIAYVREFFEIQLISDVSFQGNYLILSFSFQFVKSSPESFLVMIIMQTLNSF